MVVKVTGRHIDISEALREHVERGLTEVLGKHNIDPIESSVTVHKQSHIFHVDIHSHISKNLTLRASGEAEDAYIGFDKALDKLRTRVRRHKEWLDHHHKHHDSHYDQSEAQAYIVDSEAPSRSDEKTPLKDRSPAVIAEMKQEIPTLTVGEAIARFDFLDENAYMFKNARNGVINVIYRRRDGNIGWVDPSL